MPATSLRPSWLFGDAAIAATAADDVALGHWNRAERAGNGVVPATYSGSPELATRSTSFARAVPACRSGANHRAESAHRLPRL